MVKKVESKFSVHGNEQIEDITRWRDALTREILFLPLEHKIGFLHDPVTWYKIKNTGEQVAQWDFQNKGTCLCFGSPTVQLAHQYF